jgi:GxxExxY protein
VETAVQENDISEKIIGCCISIHKLLGPGFLESVYEEALVHELTKENLQCSRQQDIPERSDEEV